MFKREMVVELKDGVCWNILLRRVMLSSDHENAAIFRTYFKGSLGVVIDVLEDGLIRVLMADNFRLIEARIQGGGMTNDRGQRVVELDLIDLNPALIEIVVDRDVPSATNSGS